MVKMFCTYVDSSYRRKELSLYITMRTRQKRKVRRTKKGGRSYYPYNKNPLRFTAPSNKQQGGTFLQNIVERAAYGFKESNNISNGRYSQPYKNPDPLVQPISSSYKL